MSLSVKEGTTPFHFRSVTALCRREWTQWFSHLSCSNIMSMPFSTVAWGDAAFLPFRVIFSCHICCHSATFYQCSLPSILFYKDNHYCHKPTGCCKTKWQIGVCILSYSSIMTSFFVGFFPPGLKLESVFIDLHCIHSPSLKSILTYRLWDTFHIIQIT